LILQRPEHVLVAGNEVAGEPRRIFGPQDRKFGHVDGHEFSIALNLRRTPWREDEVADAGARIDHGLNQGRRRNGPRLGRAEQRFAEDGG
jgi:hypothetical protein